MAITYPSTCLEKLRKNHNTYQDILYLTGNSNLVPPTLHTEPHVQSDLLVASTWCMRFTWQCLKQLTVTCKVMTYGVLAWYQITQCYITEGNILQLLLITTSLWTVMTEGSCSQLVGHRPMEATGLFQAVCKAIPTALRIHIPLQKALLLQPKLDIFCDPLLLLSSSSSSSSSSPLCRVFILIFLRQTMSLGNTVLQLFCCFYSWCLYR